MPPKKKAPKTPRKLPSQARSRSTVDDILDATARLLEANQAPTTNAVAARAGVSVGTVYEYFPNKEAIFIAIAQRILREDERVMLAAIAPSPGEPFVARARRAVRALIALHEQNAHVRRAVMAVHLEGGLWHEQAHPAREVEAALHGEDALPHATAISRTATFVLTRAVTGAIRAALREEPALLRSQDFEDTLTLLVDRFVAAHGP
jgi:AcrR family transcriptional regulator